MKETDQKPKIAYIRAFPRSDLTSINKIRNRLERHYSYQDGFFRASLHAAFNIDEIFLWHIKKNPERLKNYDAIIVNWKCPRSAIACTEDDISFLNNIDRPKIMLAANAESHLVPSDNLMNMFDIVFKRELFKDKDRYNISESNKNKLHTTMLSCPLVKVPIGSNTAQLDIRKFGERHPATKSQYDLFFAGGCTSKNRYNIAEALYNAPNLKTDISLYSTTQFNVSDTPFERKKLNLKAYKQKTRTAKINLALQGIGPFTYRHLELWALSTFFMTPADIKELDLPIPAKDGVHYISYKNTNDLIDKCESYKNKDAERNKIAQAGRNLFEEHYNFEKHGHYIKSIIEQI